MSFSGEHQLAAPVECHIIIFLPKAQIQDESVGGCIIIIFLSISQKFHNYKYEINQLVHATSWYSFLWRGDTRIMNNKITAVERDSPLIPTRRRLPKTQGRAAVILTVIEYLKQKEWQHLVKVRSTIHKQTTKFQPSSSISRFVNRTTLSAPYHVRGQY